MRKRLSSLLAAAGLVMALAATPANAAFGFKDFDLTFTNADGSPATQAGAHPFAVTTVFHLITKLDSSSKEIPDEEIKDFGLQLPVGFAGQPTATPRCSTIDFVNLDPITERTACPNSTAVGTAGVRIVKQGPTFNWHPLFNLIPPPGVAAKLGFVVLDEPVTIEIGVNHEPPYNVSAALLNIPQSVHAYASKVEVWGNPADPAHDPYRGTCLEAGDSLEVMSTGSCPTNAPDLPFITLPRACTGPLASFYEGDSWQSPGVWAKGKVFTHDNAQIPNPQGMTGCSKLGFNPSITARPTTKAAQSPTGLDFNLDVKDEGLTSPTGIAQSDIKKAEVTLPEGMSANPSIAEGLNVCTESDLEHETVNSAPGVGCPGASKIGTVEVETPLLEEPVNGALFVAAPYENQFGSLLALYMVIKNPSLGIIVKQALKVEPDPVTGQLTTIAEDLPQLPFSHFRLHFREGARSPLASPPGCGTFSAQAALTPWSGGAPIVTTSAFQIIIGPNGGSCPSGGVPPFHPGLVAGTLNNAAGKYSPFNLRLSRNDGEQEFTRFSIKLPRGLTGKLAGIPFCADSAIEGAKSRTAVDELATPSCPAASQVGRTLAGAGVGPSLTYVPGKVYLAGPYHGSALSIVAITAVKVGPFDVGTVVIREALKVNPESAEVFVDAAGSDPIPHIIDGIPVHARDIRVYVDKPEFVLNPTSCKRTSIASTAWGSGLNFGSDADDQPFTATTPFQAADCASLGFKPKLALNLIGGTHRGDNPKLKAVLTARKGDANIDAAQVTLPHSEFLDQSHIKTICTRVQFAAGQVPGEKCPPASIYGHAKAITPLLDEPVQGPVFLRSSSHNLPDLVAALHSGKIDINLVGRIDSVKGGRIRNTFEGVPDAPVTKFTLEMQGGKKGLLVNSTNICAKDNRVIADFTGQNGKKSVFRPLLKADCRKGRKGQARASQWP